MSRKITRILLALFLSLFVLSPVLSSPNVFAYEDSKEMVFNEFDGLLEKIDQSKTTEERQYYESLKEEYKDHVYLLKSTSVSELKKLNFNEEQIKAIKQFDGSDELAALSSAYVAASLTLNDFYYNSSLNRTYIDFTFTGCWVGTPFWKLQDFTMVGAAGSAARFAQNGYSNQITFNGGQSVSNTNNTYYSMSGVVHKFGIIYGSADNFMSGFYVNYKGIADGQVTIAEYGGRYVHSYQSVDISGLSVGVSAGGTGGYGVSFGISASIQNKVNVEYHNIITRTTYTQ